MKASRLFVKSDFLFDLMRGLKDIKHIMYVIYILIFVLIVFVMKYDSGEVNEENKKSLYFNIVRTECL